MVKKRLKRDSPLFEAFNGLLPVLDIGPVYSFDWADSTEAQLMAMAQVMKKQSPEDLELQEQSLEDIVIAIKRGNIKIKAEHFE